MSRLALALLLASASFVHAVTLEEFLTKRGYTAIPIEVNIVHDYVFYGKVNGRRAVITLDTGAGGIYVDKKIAAGLKPVSEAPKKIYGAMGGEASTPGIMVRLDSIQLGSVQIEGAPAAVAPLHHKPVQETNTRIPASQTGYDLMLGWDFLRRYHAIIDAAALKLYLRPEDPPATLANEFGRSLMAGGFDLLPLTERELKVEVSAALNDQPVLFLIDTGAGVTHLDIRQAAALGMDVRERWGKVGDIAGKKEKSMFGTVRSLRIGKFDWTNMAVFVDDMQVINAYRQAHDSPEVQGLLGTEFLARARGIIDCANLRLYVHPGN